MNSAYIVDDDFTSRENIADYLIDLGWKVIVLKHPSEIIQESKKSLSDVLSTSSANLLVMDVRFGTEEVGLTQGLVYVKDLLLKNLISKTCKIVFISQFGEESTPYQQLSQSLTEAGIKHIWFNKPVDTVYLDSFINAE
jgi:hypothetical protein